jgi:hypothetical protein
MSGGGNLLTFRPRSRQKGRAPGDHEAGGPEIRPREFQLAGRVGTNVIETAMHASSSAHITVTQGPLYCKRGGRHKVFDPPIKVGTREFHSRAALTIYVRRLLWAAQRENTWSAQVCILLDLPSGWEGSAHTTPLGGRAFHVRPIGSKRWFELSTKDIVSNIISDHVEAHTSAGGLA